MLNVIMLNVIMLNVIMLNVIIPNVIMLNVAVPIFNLLGLGRELGTFLVYSFNLTHFSTESQQLHLNHNCDKVALIEEDQP